MKRKLSFAASVVGVAELAVVGVAACMAVNAALPDVPDAGAVAGALVALLLAVEREVRP